VSRAPSPHRRFVERKARGGRAVRGGASRRGSCLAPRRAVHLCTTRVHGIAFAGLAAGPTLHGMKRHVPGGIVLLLLMGCGGIAGPAGPAGSQDAAPAGTDAGDASPAATPRPDASSEACVADAPCRPELNVDGVPTRGNCCNGRHTCFSRGGDGTSGVCAYTAPPDYCAPSDARCVPAASGVPARGNCCLGRQRCMPDASGKWGICTY
jgi:hypothetical protein